MNKIFFPVLIAIIALAGCTQQGHNDERSGATKMDDPGMKGMAMDSSDSGMKMDKMSGMDMDKMSGMEMAKNDPNAHKITDVKLDDLLQPGKGVAPASVPTTSLHRETVQPELTELGSVEYDTRQMNSISARVSGRIEKLYVYYRFQHIQKGQRIMDLYSPELETGERELLFLLKNDPENTVLINAARQRLLLLGVSSGQLSDIERTGVASAILSVFSPYSGHIHEAGNTMPDAALDNGMTAPLSMKQGMYIAKGQTIFQVFDMRRSWAVLKVFPDDAALIRRGEAVHVTPETSPDKAFDAKVDEVLPLYGDKDKTLTVRLYFDNSSRDIPVGSQVKATIAQGTIAGNWLPASAVLSLGIDRVVFLRDPGGFRAHKVTTGFRQKDQVQVLSGLSPADSVAENAQYIIDSEDFIKVK